MNKYSKLIFIFFFLCAFFFEGIGIINGRDIAYNVILIMPFFLFIPQLISKSNKIILFPVKFTIIFALFIIFSLFSSVFSVNIQNAFQSLFLYIALFLVFIFVYNYKEFVRNSVIYFIFALAFIFSLFSQFIAFYIQHHSILALPIIGVSSDYYQFVYSSGSHSHLGNFLLLPLSVLIFWLLTLKSKLMNFLLLLFFTPFFLFAYSRSAYVDLVLVILFIFYYLYRHKVSLKKIFTPYLLFIILMTLTVIIFVFALPTNTPRPAILNSFNLLLQKKYGLQTGRELFASRNIYATQGLTSLVNNPLFGLGPGNFGYASEKYAAAPTLHTNTGHNLFLDIFVENGTLAGIFFLLLLLLILNSAREQFKHKLSTRQSNIIIIFLFMAMLLNFQTDYTYLIHSFFLLFFVMMGLLYEEQSTIDLKALPLFLSVILYLVFNLTMLSNIAMVNNNYALAFYANPLNKYAYPLMINSRLSINDKQSAFRYLGYLLDLFKGDSDVLTYAGDIYDHYGLEKQSLIYYERAFAANYFLSPYLAEKVYQIKLTTQGREKAKEFVDAYFLKLSKIRDDSGQYYKVYNDNRKTASEVCREIYKRNCPYAI